MERRMDEGIVSPLDAVHGVISSCSHTKRHMHPSQCLRNAVLKTLQAAELY